MSLSLGISGTQTLAGPDLNCEESQCNLGVDNTDETCG